MLTAALFVLMYRLLTNQLQARWSACNLGRRLWAVQVELVGTCRYVHLRKKNEGASQDEVQSSSQVMTGSLAERLRRRTGKFTLYTFPFVQSAMMLSGNILVNIRMK